MKTLDQRAEDYSNLAVLSKGTYKGDVITAYIMGSDDQRKIEDERVKTILSFIYNKPEYSELLSVMREVYINHWPHGFNMQFREPSTEQSGGTTQEELWNELNRKFPDQDSIIYDLMHNWIITRKQSGGTEQEIEKVFDWAKCGIYHNHAYNDDKLRDCLDVLERVMKLLNRKP